MKMIKSIMALLKTHPVFVKENLTGITRSLGIDQDIPKNATAITLCVEIENHTKDSTKLENEVREIAEKMILDHKQKKPDSATSMTGTPTENATIPTTPPRPLPPGELTTDPQQPPQATTLNSGTTPEKTFASTGATSETASIDTPPPLPDTLPTQNDSQLLLFETQKTAHEKGNESEANQGPPDREIHESEDNISDEETNEPKEVSFEATIRELVEEVKLDRIQRENEMATLREAWNDEKRLRQRQQMEYETTIRNLDKTLQKLLSENSGRNNNNKNDTSNNRNNNNNKTTETTPAETATDTEITNPKTVVISATTTTIETATPTITAPTTATIEINNTYETGNNNHNYNPNNRGVNNNNKNHQNNNIRNNLTNGSNNQNNHASHPIRKKEDKILIITDSNGKYLNVDQLKPGSHATRVTRYTTKQAVTDIPKIPHPSKVEEIVFQVGLNDLRQGATPKEIQEDVLDMQLKYYKAFPNARQHITALPPLDNKHVVTNKLLQKLSSYTESNFVSTKVFQDKTTGKMRTNTMNGFHYSAEWGIKILAKEIKKSLFSTVNTSNKQLETIYSISTSTSPNQTNETPEQPLRNRQQ
jgi:hypothetical protein